MQRIRVLSSRVRDTARKLVIIPNRTKVMVKASSAGTRTVVIRPVRLRPGHRWKTFASYIREDVLDLWKKVKGYEPSCVVNISKDTVFFNPLTTVYLGNFYHRRIKNVAILTPFQLLISKLIVTVVLVFFYG